MIAHLRDNFNASWTPALYRGFLDLLESRSGVPIPYRVNETPFFLPRALAAKLAEAGASLIEQLSTPEYRRISERSLPGRYRVPAEPDHPLFVQADFGLVKEADGSLAPKLVEIQGFPSLYAFQPVLSQAYLDAYSLPPLSYTLVDDYAGLLRRAIAGSHDPNDVVLLEIEPETQKTRADFIITEREFGVRAVCITKLRKQGNRLYDGGRLIRRIYNRAIIDELERKQAVIPFDWRDDLDVEWAGHPNFYFRVSKFAIPYLKHPSVPRTWFLHELAGIPDDLDNYVLKPLYSFAGIGVSVGPSRAEVDAVKDRENWILQERVRFEPVIRTPHGPTTVEIRVMYIWLEGEPLRAVGLIVRTGRGKMMGVDHNKNMEWVGASAALLE